MDRQFQYRNEAFTCEHCQQKVEPRSKTCRNHCPHCLTSKHVDQNPGDRANSCQGLMAAIGYEMNSQKGLVLVFKCAKCGEITRNIAANDESVMPDNYDLILSRGPYHDDD